MLTTRFNLSEWRLYLFLPVAGSLPAHSRCSRPLLSPCALVCSRGSGRHSTGDNDIRQKYGWKYAALWTCPEGSVFPAVFLWTAALQYTAARQRPCAHIPCEQVPVRQGRYPLLLPQRAPLAPATPVFAAAPTHRFTDSQQNGRPSKEDTHDEFADRLSWKGNITCGCLVTAPFWHSYAAAGHWLSPCRCQKPHGDIAVIRVGEAFSARVQRIALLACRMLLPRCARTLLNVHRWVQPQSGRHSTGDGQLP